MWDVKNTWFTTQLGETKFFRFLPLIVLEGFDVHPIDSFWPAHYTVLDRSSSLFYHHLMNFCSIYIYTMDPYISLVYLFKSPGDAGLVLFLALTSLDSVMYWVRIYVDLTKCLPNLFKFSYLLNSSLCRSDRLLYRILLGLTMCWVQINMNLTIC